MFVLFSVDIDECLEDQMCHQHCENTLGSFRCTCDAGYQLHADDITCVGKSYAHKYKYFNNLWHNMVRYQCIFGF